MDIEIAQVGKIEDLVSNIKQWFIDKGLDQGDSIAQLMKAVEEQGELAEGMNKNKLDVIKDSIGDLTVVFIGLGLQMGIGKELHSIISRIYFLSQHSTGRHTKEDNVFGISNSISSLKDSVSSGHYSYDKAMYELYQPLLCLYEIALAYDLDFIECLEHAYGVIAERKGKVIGGMFIKEGDLK